MAPANPQTPDRISGTRSAPLDLLRALAILLVLARHAPNVPAGEAPPVVIWVLNVFRMGGWVGVDLFFVLSGFLVSSLLFREYAQSGRIRVGRFLVRRAFRIYPAFYCLLAGTICVAVWLGRPVPGWKILMSEALFVQNYGPSLFPQTWSLAIEEHFYLLLPGVFLLLRGSKERPFASLPKACLIIMLLALGGRLLTAELMDFRLKTHLFATHLRVDSLFFGVFIAWLRQYHRVALESFVRIHRLSLLFLGLILVSPAFFLTLGKSTFLTTFGLTSLTLASGCVLLASLSFQWAPNSIAQIGAHSYSIYLWHMTILMFGFPFLPPHVDSLTRYALFFVASILFGMLMARLIERPFLAVRDRLFPAMATHQSGQSAPVLEPLLSK